ncbi:ABC transporter ATP-binding protein [Enterococcus sp. DIV0170]|uniref:ABC transporter ATP-binding protein n=1 Tax=Enterococcus sp. DIV0170 TaxID=2774642 RepID=UPI003F1FF948
MIEMTNVSKIYQTGKVASQALKEISLTIEQGEYVLLTGRSGSGKSTLLNILSGVDQLTEGNVVINHQHISSLREEELSSWRGKELGIIFQFFQLIPTLSVMENLLLPMDLIGAVPSEEREAKAYALLEMVGLEKHQDKLPSALSGGEQQRVAIARSLANDAPLILADEPTGNLDSVNAESIFSLLRELHLQGKTIVMVTHEREEIDGATRKITLKDGHIIEDKMIGGYEHVLAAV